MAASSSGCRRSSRSAIRAAWTRLAGEIPTYRRSDGLLRYWPADSLDGSDALTAYALSITAEAGLPIPEGPRRQA